MYTWYFTSASLLAQIFRFQENPDYERLSCSLTLFPSEGTSLQAASPLASSNAISARVVGGGGGGGGGVGRGSSTLRRLTIPFLGFDLLPLELEHQFKIRFVHLPFKMFKDLPCGGLILNAVVGDLAEDAVHLCAQLAAVCGCCHRCGLVSGGVLLPNLLALRRRRRGSPLLLLG